MSLSHIATSVFDGGVGESIQ